MSRRIRLRSGFSAMLLAGTLLVASASSALAGNNQGFTFKDFRQENPGMDRHAARALFRESNGGGRNRAEGMNLNIAGQASNIRNAIQAPRIQNLNTNMIHNQRNQRGQRGQTTQVDIAGNMLKLSSGLDLDLTSNSKNIVLGKNLFGDQATVEISTGDGTKTLTAGSQVSAAEYIAVKQVLSGAGQRLTLDRSGKATGGAVDLDAITATNDTMRAASLVVATGVTTTGDFSKRSDFKLLGDLNNFGTVLAESGVHNARAGAIRADDINNFSGATISSNLDLTLDASGSLNNAGTISSSQGLTLAAGNTINNRGLVNAARDLTVNASKVNNRGSISSANGNVNLSGPQDAVLLVNNSHGSISALSGAINLRDSSYDGEADTWLVGGDLLSKQFNMHAGQGTAFVDVNELTGNVSQTGSAAHLVASTDILKIGDVCLTGDPTFFNTAGSIDIDGTLTVAEQLVLVASGDINVEDGVTVTAGDAANNGFKITMIAGADVTNSGGQNVNALSGTPPTAGLAGAVSLSGKKSKTGGNIELGAGSSIRSQAEVPGVNSNGGTVEMFAFDGKGTDGNGGGVVNLSGGSILTGGSGTGNNGSITIIAGASKPLDGNAVLTGTLDTSGGSGTKGSISIRTTGIAPFFKKIPIEYDQFGILTSSNFLTGVDKANAKAGILFNGPVSSSGAISTLAGNEIYIQNAVTAVDSIVFEAGGDITDGGGPPPVVSGFSVIFKTEGNVGTVNDAFGINAPRVGVRSGGSTANIEVIGTGAFTIVEAEVPKGRLSIDAAGRDVGSSTNIFAENLFVRGATLTTFSDVLVGNTAEFVATAGGISNATFSVPVQAPVLRLSAQNDIGSSANRFQLDSSTALVFVDSSSGDVFLNSNRTKDLTYGEARANNGTLDISAAASVTMAALEGDTTADDIAITLLSGSLTIAGTMSAGNTLTLTNPDFKGKMAFQQSAHVSTTTGNLAIVLGPVSATVTTLPIPNVAILNGPVTLTGEGLKAKAPTNTLSQFGGPTLSINNGNKSGNLTFAGSVLIHAGGLP